MDQLRTFMEKEMQIQEVIIQKYEHEVQVYRESLRKFKAILRVPRLCRQYHDKMSQGKEELDLELLD